MWKFYLSLFLAYAYATKACPEPTSGGSATKGHPCKLIIANKVPEDMFTHWVDFAGEEKEGNDLYVDAVEEHGSYTGHKFRFRTSTGVLVKEYVLPAKCPTQGSVRVEIESCEGLHPKPDDNSWYDKSWDETFSSLVLPTQCDTSLPSSQWSCVRRLGEKEVKERVQGRYGFLPNETKGGRHAYQVKDDGYVEHIPRIPHLTSQAFLIMWQPEPIRKLLQDFYAQHQNTSAIKVHEPIAGMYSNVHSIHMSKLNLDEFIPIRTKIVKEMQKVLEWWTHLRLRHTSTFGVRVYHRNSMLINHVDRHDTHLASAVLQIAQDAEEGWPLEMLSESGHPIEAFLQPGQMVLYEGARVFHGRPMRFVGKDFANVFSHFAPVGYGGLGTGEKFDYRFRKGEAEAGWPRVIVGSKESDDSESCDDTESKTTAEKKKEESASWWPF